jgi:putative transposase
LDIIQQFGQVLEKVGIRKLQRGYLEMLMGLWLAIPGRVNFLNLERYGELSERSHRGWFEKPMDFVGVNAGIVRALVGLEALEAEGWGLGIDASFIKKSGKATPNLGRYWNSQQNKAVKGLEVSCCSLIGVSLGQAFGLHLRPTQSSERVRLSRMEQYAGHLHEVLGSLPPDLRERIKYVVADGYYSKESFIRAVGQQEKYLVSKLRQDANLKYLYAGPKSTGKGRPKLYAGKVEYSDFSRWERVSTEVAEVVIYSVVAYSVKFKMSLRVVAVVEDKLDGTLKHQLFFSTDLTQDPLQILRIYSVRFQIEFLFRDTKQHLGLQDCQSRQPKAIEFHYNMALTTLNAVKLHQLNLHLQTHHPDSLDNFTFSIEDAKRRAYNQLFAKRFLSILPQIPTCNKYLKQLQQLLNLGVKAA